MSSFQVVKGGDHSIARILYISVDSISYISILLPYLFDFSISEKLTFFRSSLNKFYFLLFVQHFIIVIVRNKLKKGSDTSGKPKPRLV